MPRLRSRPDERNPDTVFLFGLCILAGAGQAAAGAPPGSVEALLPPWAALGWGLTLMLGGLLVLWGTLDRNAERGEAVELVGRALFGPLALSYGVALLGHQSRQGVESALLAAAPFVGFSLTCLWRAFQIVRRRNRAVARTRRQ